MSACLPKQTSYGKVFNIYIFSFTHRIQYFFYFLREQFKNFNGTIQLYPPVAPRAAIRLPRHPNIPQDTNEIV